MKYEMQVRSVRRGNDIVFFADAVPIPPERDRWTWFWVCVVIVFYFALAPVMLLKGEGRNDPLRPR